MTKKMKTSLVTKLLEAHKQEIQKTVDRFNKDLIALSIQEGLTFIPEIRTAFDEATGIFQLKLNRVTTVTPDTEVPAKIEAALEMKEIEVCAPESKEVPSSEA